MQTNSKNIRGIRQAGVGNVSQISGKMVKGI
jgi:hypothetical protein